jgi:hypothetical protein
MILDEAAGKNCGATHWEFNVFAITLDFDEGLAIVEDILPDGATDSVDLQTFLERAAAFGDPATAGDGLTEAQRHPPRYEVDSHGDVDRLNE